MENLIFLSPTSVYHFFQFGSLDVIFTLYVSIIRLLIIECIVICYVVSSICVIYLKEADLTSVNYTTVDSGLS